MLIEFWSYAIREPALRERLAARFAAFRSASTRLVLEGAAQRGFPPNAGAGEIVGGLIFALGNGLALEKLVDPDGVPDSRYGDMLVLIIQALQALARESLTTPDQETAGSAHEVVLESRDDNGG